MIHYDVTNLISKTVGANEKLCNSDSGQKWRSVCLRAKLKGLLRNVNDQTYLLPPGDLSSIHTVWYLIAWEFTHIPTPILDGNASQLRSFVAPTPESFRFTSEEAAQWSHWFASSFSCCRSVGTIRPLCFSCASGESPTISNACDRSQPIVRSTQIDRGINTNKGITEGCIRWWTAFPDFLRAIRCFLSERNSLCVFVQFVIQFEFHSVIRKIILSVNSNVTNTTCLNLIRKRTANFPSPSRWTWPREPWARLEECHGRTSKEYRTWPGRKL